jgi:hypothetical protein
MTPSIKLSEYLYEIATGENGEGNKQRGREREKGSDSSRVRDGALDRSGNGAGWKWPLVKKDTCVYLVKQSNRIKRDIGWILDCSYHWCLNICSHDDMFHHKFSMYD